MKKIFENAVWWSGVITVGLVLGISLQFVRAWTEPTVGPPNGNVGAPINTGIIEQLKQGALGVNGLLKVYGGLQLPTGAQPGYVLTAQPDPINPAISNGQAAWAAGGSGHCQWYDFENVNSSGADTYKCVDINDIKTKGATGSCYYYSLSSPSNIHWGVIATGMGYSCPNYGGKCYIGCGGGSDGICGAGNAGPTSGARNLKTTDVAKYYACN